MIYGRDKELNILHQTLMDDQSHFIAVYGRRRIGKTYLIREAFNYRFTFSHAGIANGNLSEQLFGFEASIKDGGGQPSAKVTNWLKAFEDLKDLIRNSSEKKKVIFIDELSWMDTQNCDLLKALESFWNGWASGRKDIVLIVCASATSWMLSKVVHNKGGLYNRLTGQIHLHEFSLGECEEFTKSKNIVLGRDQILQYYMIFGGVPYYWDFIQKGESLSQNIDRILFERDAPLRDEFEYLYASIFKNPTTYIRIIETLSKKKVGMTREELIRESGLHNSGDLSTKLAELENCDFIRKYSAYGMNKKNAVYQLVDFFTLFYYRFIEKQSRDEHFWSELSNTSEGANWMGLAFERVCLSHIRQIKQKLGIAGVQTNVNSWYCNNDADKGIHGSQIDLLIVRKDQVINLCEMKYSNAAYSLTKKDEEAIKTRISDLKLSTKTKYAIFPTLVTTDGMVENIHSGIIQSVVTLDDLFVIV